MGMQKRKIDTTVKIMQEGVYYARTWNSTAQNSEWGITDWYDFIGLTGTTFKVHGYVGFDNTTICFWYENTAATYRDFWYIANAGNEGDRTCGLTAAAIDIARIRFSIQLSKIDDAFMYVYQTGQILFAGKNTPYYGYTNINDMPSA